MEKNIEGLLLKVLFAFRQALSYPQWSLDVRSKARYYCGSRSFSFAAFADKNE